MLNVQRRWGTLCGILLIGSALFGGEVIGNDGKGHPGPVAPKGYVLVDEEAWIRLAEEPGRHMQHAKAAFLKHDMVLAAAEIRKAECYLRASASHAHHESRIALLNCAHDFEHLAKQVERGHIQSAAELDSAFARAQHSLAQYYYLKAADHWGQREATRAGLYLRAAANNLEDSAAYTGKKLKSGVHELVHDTRAVAGKLVGGTEVVVDEVSKGFERFSHGTNAVGHDIWAGEYHPYTVPTTVQP